MTELAVAKFRCLKALVRLNAGDFTALHPRPAPALPEGHDDAMDERRRNSLIIEHDLAVGLYWAWKSTQIW